MPGGNESFLWSDAHIRRSVDCMLGRFKDKDSCWCPYRQYLILGEPKNGRIVYGIQPDYPEPFGVSMTQGRSGSTII